MKSPNFLIIGTMKSGTSSLADMLNESEHIELPKEELHFFDNESNYAKGIEDYLGKFSESSKNAVIGEKTPTYSYHSASAERIAKHFPDIQLIWIFRNPAKRTLSNYLHYFKYGRETLSFKEAIKLEEQRMTENPYFGYVERSRYDKQVAHYLNYFALEQMHFLTFEKLIEDPLTELNKITAFLGVDNFSDAPCMIQSNRTLVPRYIRLVRLTRLAFGEDSAVYKRIYRILSSRFVGKAPMKMELETYNQLTKGFKDSNKRLAELTGLDLSLWDSQQ